MNRIASPRDLQAELHALMTFIRASEKPDRQVLATKLVELADRLAATNLWKYTDEEGNDFFLKEKKTGTIRSPFTGKSFTAKPTRETMGDVAKALKEG